MSLEVFVNLVAYKKEHKTQSTIIHFIYYKLYEIL